MVGQCFFGFGRQRQLEAESLRQALAGFGREAFEVIARECPDVAHFGQVPLDFERPALEGRFSFPEKFFVAMQMCSVGAVFRRVIAEQPEIKKIGRARQKLERREIAFVERAGVGPNPADAIFFEQADDLGAMPAGMTEFNRETKCPRQLGEKFTQGLPAIFWCERGRELDKDDLQFRREGIDCAKECS